MLRDLTIKNYRSFKDFHVDGLARVNLMVGMNNHGKTSLLEAIYILKNNPRLWSLIELAIARGEVAQELPVIPQSNESMSYPVHYPFSSIFHDRTFQIGDAIYLASNQDSPLSLKILIEKNGDLSQYSGDSEDAYAPLILTFYEGEKVKFHVPMQSDGWLTSYSSRRVQSASEFSPRSATPILFLTTNSLNVNRLGELWDQSALTPKEDRVIAALKILEPRIERISFTTKSQINSDILLKLSGESHPIPLSSMGDGMRRILTLVMAAVTTENGILLVDEIDAGLHYKTQTDMWRLILETAQQLKVQVFATTHSWDCVCAFQEALEQASDPLVGKLFRLDARGEEIRAVSYTPDELSVAVRQSIEVR
jgi:AAA domain, putative AbiEii toxin, Type IV TA system